MATNRLALLEARLQSLVEGSVARLFPASPAPHDLAARLLAALQAGVEVGPDGLRYAPGHFILLAPPRLADGLQKSPDLLKELVRALREAGLESGLRFAGSPEIEIVPDASLAAGEVFVLAESSPGQISQTSEMPLELPEDVPGPSKAFLIVDGVRVFSLQSPVVNIGRHSDNQLVIADARVSRRHAQLRAMHGRYVIFDLDSRGGTWINGQRIRQSALKPGDVISLAGVPLIFGQEAFVPGETQEYVPPD